MSPLYTLYASNERPLAALAYVLSLFRVAGESDFLVAAVAKRFVLGSTTPAQGDLLTAPGATAATT